MRPYHQLALAIPLALMASSGRGVERIVTHDNLEPAGVLTDGVLRLRLDARAGDWHPDGDDAPGGIVQAFAADDGAPSVPGPLLRVPAGTEVVVRLSNSIPGSTLVVHGLVSRPARNGDAGAVRLAAGESREVRFRLDAPGTYHYWGETSGRSFLFRTREDAQLSGAIVVDEPRAASAPAGGPRDRVLVVGLWADTVGGADITGRDHGRLLFVVNGRSWPHTTRLSYAVGDTVRLRLVNASADLHPMHLHGFYYRIDARGDGTTDSTYDDARRELAVTERLLPGRTMSLSWAAERAGNWLLHCHTTAHFSPRGPLGMPPDEHALREMRAPAAGAHANHALEGMNGLVVGIVVAPRPGAPASLAGDGPVARRRLRLLVRPNAGSTDARPLYGFAVQEGSVEPPVGTGLTVGPPIVLERGVPVSITVVNRTPETTAVHWHGIELESYFDGVAGFSGSAARLSPAIAPADSFEARFTPPRAGTFIYHTHIDELRQQPAGLAGPLIVVEPGDRFDPSSDTPILMTTPRDEDDAARAVLLNGSAAPPPLVVRAGAPHRLRLINMTTARPGVRFELHRDTTLLSWRQLAKDGAALPAARRAPRPARQPVAIGETVDVELVDPRPGELRLEVWTTTERLMATLPIRVTGAAETLTTRAP